MKYFVIRDKQDVYLFEADCIIGNKTLLCVIKNRNPIAEFSSFDHWREVEQDEFVKLRDFLSTPKTQS